MVVYIFVVKAFIRKSRTIFIQRYLCYLNVRPGGKEAILVDSLSTGESEFTAGVFL